MEYIFRKLPYVFMLSFFEVSDFLLGNLFYVLYIYIWALMEFSKCRYLISFTLLEIEGIYISILSIYILYTYIGPQNIWKIYVNFIYWCCLVKILCTRLVKWDWPGLKLMHLRVHWTVYQIFPVGTDSSSFHKDLGDCVQFICRQVSRWRSCSHDCLKSTNRTLYE